MSDTRETVDRNVKAVVARDATPISTKGRDDAVKLRMVGVVELLDKHSPDAVVIEVELTGGEPTLANGHKLISANKIISAGTCYKE